MNTLLSISPIDGRYRSKVAQLEHYFSEFALIKYRVRVEIEYFIEIIGEVLSLSFFKKKTCGRQNFVFFL